MSEALEKWKNVTDQPADACNNPLIKIRGRIQKWRGNPMVAGTSFIVMTNLVDWAVFFPI